jgi:hypothetical protein
MTVPIAVVFVPVPVPVGSGNNGWCRNRPPAPYPREVMRDGWSKRQPIPIPARDDRAIKDLLRTARHVIARQRTRQVVTDDR